MPLYYEKGDLFCAPVAVARRKPREAGHVLVHSCSARGVWGAGVALQMAKLYPRALGKYRNICKQAKHDARFLGTSIMHEEVPGTVYIASLIVSSGYGAQKDPPEAILQHTRAALHHAVDSFANREQVSWHSPRINAGLFGVPWEHTEAVLHEAVAKYNLDWTVWTI